MGIEHARGLPEEGLVVPGDVIMVRQPEPAPTAHLVHFTGVGSTDVASAMATGGVRFEGSRLD